LRQPVWRGYGAPMTKKSPNSSPDADAAADEPPLDFETALADLETLVERMESGEMSLEESLQAFERGVKLTRHCQNALKSAELKVKVLTENDDLVNLDLDSASDE
jgi:exodeoxyribonuclease VII small subunit